MWEKSLRFERKAHQSKYIKNDDWWTENKIATQHRLILQVLDLILLTDSCVENSKMKST